MMQRSPVILAGSLLLFVMSGAQALRADPYNSGDQAAPAPDNSRMNTRDRDQTQPTADQAKNGKSDVDIMRQIRRAIVEDKTLSTYAHNIKVIAQEGRVTLKGTVQTEDEKSTIAAKAADVVGADNVTNRITVKGS